jgi:hypothetical protein
MKPRDGCDDEAAGPVQHHSNRSGAVVSARRWMRGTCLVRRYQFEGTKVLVWCHGALSAIELWWWVPTPIFTGWEFLLPCGCPYHFDLD